MSSAVFLLDFLFSSSGGLSLKFIAQHCNYFRKQITRLSPAKYQFHNLLYPIMVMVPRKWTAEGKKKTKGGMHCTVLHPRRDYVRHCRHRLHRFPIANCQHSISWRCAKATIFHLKYCYCKGDQYLRKGLFRLDDHNTIERIVMVHTNPFPKCSSVIALSSTHKECLTSHSLLRPSVRLFFLLLVTLDRHSSRLSLNFKFLLLSKTRTFSIKEQSNGFSLSFSLSLLVHYHFNTTWRSTCSQWTLSTTTISPSLNFIRKVQITDQVHYQHPKVPIAIGLQSFMLTF